MENEFKPIGPSARLLGNDSSVEPQAATADSDSNRAAPAPSAKPIPPVLRKVVKDDESVVSTMSIPDVIAKLRANHLPNGRFLLDFGPFTGVESRLRQSLDGFDNSHPEISDYFRDAYREAIHQAFTVTPSAADRGDAGLAV